MANSHYNLAATEEDANIVKEFNREILEVAGVIICVCSIFSILILFGGIYKKKGGGPCFVLCNYK